LVSGVVGIRIDAGTQNLTFLAGKNVIFLVHKFGKLVFETQPDITRGAITVLGHNDFSNALEAASGTIFVNLVVLRSVDETDNVGVLLNGTRLTKVGKLRTLGERAMIGMFNSLASPLSERDIILTSCSRLLNCDPLAFISWR